MTLSKTGLKSALQAIGPQPTAASAAAAWAGAIVAYASSIIPASGAVSGAHASLQSALQAAFAGESAAADMETAMHTFVTTVAGGMAGFMPTVIPALGGIGFATRFAVNRSTAAAGATEIADAIDDWFGTGSSTLIAPPNTLTPWT